MRSGLESTSFDNYGAWVRSRNWVTYVLNQPLVSEPGTTMEYSTGSTHLLSAILTSATKRSTWAFLQESLGKPLGFTFSRWPRDPQGIYFGGNDMLMTPRQMVAFGELYLNRGRVGDRQIVPASWVDASCTPRGRSRFNPDQTYGYGWWMRDFAGRPGVFRVGLRRAVHHDLPRSRPGRGDDVVHRRQRRAPRLSAAAVRSRRAPDPRSRAPHRYNSSMATLFVLLQMIASRPRASPAGAQRGGSKPAAASRAVHDHADDPGDDRETGGR